MGMTKVLVAGGAGFLGSVACAELLNAGNEVYCVDNFSSGTMRNLHAFLSNEKFFLIEHDLLRPLEIDIDCIFHFASPASPVDYMRDPVNTMRVCANATQTLLDLAAQTNARMVHASTSEVYGNPKIHPQPESYFGNVNPVGARSCYVEGKRFAESLCLNYHNQYDVDVRIARIFNTYGPSMRSDDGRVISSFVGSALAGSPLFVHGDGLQTRSFCHADDLVRGLILLMGLAGPEVIPINLGNPEELRIRDVAELVVKLTSSRSQVVHLPATVDEVTRRKPDVSRAKELLGWEPTTTFEEGLAAMIAGWPRANAANADELTRMGSTNDKTRAR